MAVGAMIALVHDVIITAGDLRAGRPRGHAGDRDRDPHDPGVLALRHGGDLRQDQGEHGIAGAGRTVGYVGVVDLSLNQTIMRSVNTSLVVLLPILSLLLFGGETLKDFAFAMFVGVGIGAYSSIFIAAPVLTIFKERETRVPRELARAPARRRGARPPPQLRPPASATAVGCRGHGHRREASAPDRRSRPAPEEQAPPAAPNASGGSPWRSSRSRR